jgi:hypothetical protein
VSVVRDRADARWLPSRFDFALFRLFAYFRLKTIQPVVKRGLVLSIERHQSAVENYLITICVCVVITAFLASIIAATLPLGAACLIALPATGVLVSVEIVMMGVAIAPLVRKVTGMSGAASIALNSVVMSAIAMTAAVLLSVSSSPLRHIGTAYLILIAANAVASVVVFLMQRRIADLERRYGVES